MTRTLRSLTVLALTTLLSGTAFAGGGNAPVVSRPVAPVTTSTNSLASLSAKALLNKAIEANGGQALRNLKNMVATGTIEYYDTQGQVVSKITTEMVVDYATQQSRQSLLDGDKVATTIYVTKDGAFTTSAQSGTVPMPAKETENMRESFYYGAPGLLKGELPGSFLKNLGNQTWLDLGGNKLSGTVLEITSKAAKGTFMLNNKGELIAERYPIAPVGDTISVYSQRYVLDGVLTPKLTAVFAPNGMLLFTITDTGAKANQKLAPDTFVVPE